jgi:S1-C subfamily serine protease
MLGQMLGGLIGGWARRSLWVVPPLRILDSMGGVVLGALTGLAGVWVLGTVLLYVPGEDDLRRYAQESRIVSSLTSAVPADRVMDALGKIDPFLTLVGPSSGVDDPDPAIVRDPDVRLAQGSVVRIRGIACGAGIEGSGWIAGEGLVVTNAHVAAGISNPLVDRGGGRALRGFVVAFDSAEDVAVIRVPGLEGRALRLGASGSGAPVAVLGFPGNGPYVSRPARVGRTATVTSRDAYGRIRLARTVVAFRGQVEGGSSGGPLVDANGDVAATVFARRRASSDGYAVPNDLVREVLERAGSQPVASKCVER